LEIDPEAAQETCRQGHNLSALEQIQTRLSRNGKYERREQSCKTEIQSFQSRHRKAED